MSDVPFYWSGGATHVDPSGVPLDDLARIRGAMWSVRWDGAYGPRPGDPSNILAMDYYEWYPPDERARMRAIYKTPGYRHAVTGPLVDPGGYHGLYPKQPDVPTQAEFDHYLDCMQEWWDDGIVPVHFVHPDNWTFEETRDRLTALYAQERARRLLRIKVPTGWEPSDYQWSSNTWILFMDWMRAIDPACLLLMHTPSDCDCPNGRDANGDDSPDVPYWGRIWAKYVQHCHGWLVQNGPYRTGPRLDPNLAANFANQWQDFYRRFHEGKAGWPTTSLWGDRPFKYYNAECTAYMSFWQNLPQASSQDWGDLAMANRSDGYLDGGRADVS